MKENTLLSTVLSQNSGIDRILIDVCLESEIICRAVIVSSFFLGCVLDYMCSEVLPSAPDLCVWHAGHRYPNRRGGGGGGGMNDTERKRKERERDTDKDRNGNGERERERNTDRQRGRERIRQH